jgi:hypothetical protein
MRKLIKTELKSLYLLICKSIKGIIVAAIIFMPVWVIYKFLPEGNDLLIIILNASGLAGASAILGVLYNKTKNDVERPKVTVNNLPMADKIETDFEESLKKSSVREALDNLVDTYKKHLEENSKLKERIKFSECYIDPFMHKEKVFSLQPDELMLQSYERECEQMLTELEQERDYFFYPLPLYFFNRILTAQYLFTDPAAENKICLDVYVCKTAKMDKTRIEIFGYVIVYAYYNTEMFVSCQILRKRSADDVARRKAWLNSVCQ